MKTIILVFSALLCSCGAAAPIVSLAQHVAAPYQFVPSADAGAIGSVSIRGVGFHGHGDATVNFVRVTETSSETLYVAKLSIDGCVGLELVIDGGKLRLDRVEGREAVAIWPLLECGESTALVGGPLRTTIYERAVK